MPQTGVLGSFLALLYLIQQRPSGPGPRGPAGALLDRQCGGVLSRGGVARAEVVSKRGSAVSGPAAGSGGPRLGYMAALGRS